MLVHLGLGSNVGDRLGYLGAAAASLAELGAVVARSSVWQTAPVDAPPGAGDFFNAALALETALEPERLLDAVLAIERSAGRHRGAVRNAPRTLDLDLLLWGELIVSLPGRLEIPHPRLAERAFVLAPLCEIAPAAVHPLLHCSMSALAAALPWQRVPPRRIADAY